MSNKEILARMRKPSDTEKDYIKAQLYYMYTRRTDIFTILEMLCLIMAISMVLILLETKHVTHFDIITIALLVLAGGVFLLLHIWFAHCTGMCKDLNGGSFKVIPCVMYDLKFETIRTRKAPKPYARVRFNDNEISSEYFRVDSTTTTRLRENSELPLMLVTNSTYWRIIQMSEWR